MLNELSCPACGAPGLETHQPDGHVICRFCGNQFASENEVACPHCESLNFVGSDFCQSCRTPLKRTCHACSSENWSGAEFCAQCGRGLDILEGMATRLATGHRETLNHQRNIAAALKAEEAEATERRRDALWQQDKRWQDELAQRQRKSSSEQRLILMVLIVAAVVFIGVLIVAAILLPPLR